MKKIYLLLLPVLFLWGSCSMDDVLESNGGAEPYRHRNQ